MSAKIFCRLRSAAGETLVEMMAAILIFTLSSILFLSMASAAARINTQARAADSAYQDQQRIAETGLSASGSVVSDGTVDVSSSSTKLSSQGVKIVQQSGEEGALYAYYPQG